MPQPARSDQMIRYLQARRTVLRNSLLRQLYHVCIQGSHAQQGRCDLLWQEAEQLGLDIDELVDLYEGAVLGYDADEIIERADELVDPCGLRAARQPTVRKTVTPLNLLHHATASPAG